MLTPGRRGGSTRQQRLLDVARDPQLVVEPLLLALHVEQVLDAAAHPVEATSPGPRAGRREVDVDPVAEVALARALGALEELVHR